jgi:single-strand DNA-binding protein
MSTSVNKVILIGNLGKDPIVGTTNDGNKIANLSLATSESWKDKISGEKVFRTEWHKIVIYNNALSEAASTYLKKGSKVYVEGQLQTRKWVDNNEVEHSTTEVVISRFNGMLISLNNTNNHVGGEPFTQSFSSAVDKEEPPF